MESSQYSTQGQFDGYGVTSSINESTSYQVFPQEQFQFNSNLSSAETTGSTSYQYTSQGYGYGYWNGYGVPNSNEETPYYSSTEPKDEESEIRALREYLESLYFESQDLFKKVFPELLEKYKGKKGSKEDKAKAKSFTKVLKKLAMKLHKKKLGQLNVQTMRRSLSLGSPHTPTQGGGSGSSFKLEWFRIKTLQLGGGGVDTRHGGQGTNRFV
ncbi:hypothetical protein ACHQM5_004033 [Ranunculus cassubicifolius]